MVSYRKRKKAYQTAKRKGKTYQVTEPNFRSNIYIESADINPNNPLELREVNRANHMLFQVSHLFDREIVLKDVSKEELAWITSNEFQSMTSYINDTIRLDPSAYKDTSKIFKAPIMMDKVLHTYITGNMSIHYGITKASDFRKQFSQGYKKFKHRLNELNINVEHLKKVTIPPAQIVYYNDSNIRA